MVIVETWLPGTPVQRRPAFYDPDFAETQGGRLDAEQQPERLPVWTTSNWPNYDTFTPAVAGRSTAL